MKLYPHQERVFGQLKALLKKERIVCIAATTGFGKTEIICKFIEDNPGKRFLILAHGQTVLRRNFYERLVGRKSLAKDVLEVENARSLKWADDHRVLVALPQTIHRNLQSLDQFDFLIVDEAHEYYVETGKNRQRREMYGKILRWHKGKEIILTASHYVLKKVPKIFFSREEALQLGKLADVQLSVKESAFKLKAIKSMYNETGDLRTTVDVKGTIKDIVPYLKRENYPMIVARHSQRAADQLGAFLAKDPKYKGRFTVSHGSNDETSENIDAFKAGKYDICIVVQRGSLGFDYPDLATYLDATFTRSLTRIEQMVGRVARLSSKSRHKKFIKLSADGIEIQTNLLIVGVLALGEKSLYERWNELEKDIPLKREALKKASETVGRIEPNTGKDPPVPQYLMSFSEYYRISDRDHVTFSEAMSMVKNINGRRSSRQQEILDWAKSGKPKPGKKDPNWSLFQTYLVPSQKCYDPAFIEVLKKIVPHWFEKKTDVEGNKAALLKLAKKGKPKPKHSEKLGGRFYEYTNKTLSGYDPDFTATMQKLVPDWFMTIDEQVADMKQKILNMAKSGKEPPAQGSEYYSRYRGYLSPSSRTYDFDFLRKLHKTAPHWFRFPLEYYERN